MANRILEPCANTDRELWREVEGDYYANSIHVTEDGSIGISVGGNVIVKPLTAWHELARIALNTPGMTELVVRLRRQAKCVYIAVEETIADDIADAENKAASALESQSLLIARLEKELGRVTGSREPSPSSTGLGRSGFDPARVQAALERRIAIYSLKKCRADPLADDDCNKHERYAFAVECFEWFASDAGLTIPRHVYDPADERDGA